MRNMDGRTIIVEPIRVDESATDAAGKPRPEAYFHLTIVDGGPLQYGDNQDRDVSKQRPNTHEIATPCRFANINSYSFGFVQVVRDCLANGEPGRVGVVQQGTQGNRPWLITKTSTDVHGNERRDGQARFDAAMAIFGQLWADKHAAPGAPRQFSNPTARSLVAPAAYPSAPQVNYGQPQPSPQQQYAAAATQGYPTYGPPAPQQYAAPAQPYSAPPAYGQAPQYGAAPVVGAMPQGAPSAFAAAAAPELAAMAAQIPPHVEAWLASLDPATAAQQRAAFLANAGQPQGGAPVYGPGPGI
jgi:hypothetical protein